MKLILIPVLLSLFSISAFAQNTNPLADVQAIECQKADGSTDFVSLKPGVVESLGKSYTAVTAHKVYPNGAVEDKGAYLYETEITPLRDGSSLIQLKNAKFQFQTDREVSLLTKDFEAGHFVKVAFQPGTGGYGEGGIPQGTTVNMLYNCKFIRN